MEAGGRGWMDRQRWMDEQMDGWMDKSMGGWIDGWMNGWWLAVLVEE